jgi:hypothetical protein
MLAFAGPGIADRSATSADERRSSRVRVGPRAQFSFAKARRAIMSSSVAFPAVERIFRVKKR